MNFVDTGKAGLARLQDRLMPQRVVFHHVPKCGGTSVGRALRKRYVLSQATVIPESSYRAFEAFTGRKDRERMLVDVLDLREQMLLYLLYEDVRCISLHVRFSRPAWERFHHSYKFITILREPVSRFVSHYHWSHGKPHAHARIEEDFVDFLSTDRARRLGAIYSEYFSGLPKETDFRSDAAVTSAVETLGTFDVAGTLDDLPTFREDVRRRVGVRLRIGHENKGRPGRAAAPRSLSPELYEKVRDLCAPDLAIWDAVHG